MHEAEDLYQEMILDHYRRPRNRRAMETADAFAEGYNPLCGDRVKVYVQVEDGIVKDVSFQGAGCAISTASASLMTESIRGKSLEQARALFNRFHGLITGEPAENGAPELGKLEVFSGVGKYPARVKCATLVWHTVNAALENRKETVTTE